MTNDRRLLQRLSALLLGTTGSRVALVELLFVVTHHFITIISEAIPLGINAILLGTIPISCWIFSIALAELHFVVTQHVFHTGDHLDLVLRLVDLDRL